MPVPKATVNKDGLFARAKNDVWFAWQLRCMQSISVTHGVQHSPDNQLGFGILCLNSRHVKRACRRHVTGIAISFILANQ